MALGTNSAGVKNGGSVAAAYVETDSAYSPGSNNNQPLPLNSTFEWTRATDTEEQSDEQGGTYQLDSTTTGEAVWTFIQRDNDTLNFLRGTDPEIAIYCKELNSTAIDGYFMYLVWIGNRKKEFNLSQPGTEQTFTSTVLKMTAEQTIDMTIFNPSNSASGASSTFAVTFSGNATIAATETETIFSVAAP